MLGKGVQIAFVILFVMLTLTSFLGLPPSRYFINWYLDTFETNRYSVILITLMQFFPVMMLYLGMITLRTLIRRSRHRKS